MRVYFRTYQHLLEHLVGIIQSLIHPCLYCSLKNFLHSALKQQEIWIWEMGIGEKEAMYSFGEIRMRSCSSSERTGRGMGEAQLHLALLADLHMRCQHHAFSEAAWI